MQVRLTCDCSTKEAEMRVTLGHPVRSVSKVHIVKKKLRTTVSKWQSQYSSRKEPCRMRQGISVCACSVVCVDNSAIILSEKSYHVKLNSALELPPAPPLCVAVY